jgi:hypothetical protein
VHHLATSVESGNLGLNKAVIRWMSGKMSFETEEQLILRAAAAGRITIGAATSTLPASAMARCV